MERPADNNSNRAIVAERNVLGCVLLDDRCMGIALELLSPQDFLFKPAGLVFGAMKELYNSGSPINIATILAIVCNDPFFKSDEGVRYLTVCSNELPFAGSIEHFCSIVRSESTRRKVVAFSEKLRNVDWSPTEKIEDQIAKLGNELLDLTSDTSTTPWVDFTSALKTTYEDLAKEDDETKITTGFIDLDAKLTGIRPGKLTIVAARPAMGKTAFGLNVMENIAFNLHVPVAFFSLEMTTIELVHRVLSAMTSVPGQAIDQKRMDDDEWNRVLDVANTCADAKIYIDETPGLDVAVLKERTRRLYRQYGIGAVIIDYLQLMHASGKNINNREQEVAAISRELKGLSKELKIPVIALSQLNREVSSRVDKRPILSDIRESGSIEQDADNILFIHRDDYYNPSGEKNNKAEIIIAKQRGGPTGIIELHWDGRFTRFSNLETEFN